MKLPISRGVVRHNLYENFLDLSRTIFNRKSSIAETDAKIFADLRFSINEHFSDRHVTFFPFARTALHGILKGLNLPPGSRILMTPFNIGPMIDVVKSLGHEAVFIDIDENTFGPCLDSLREEAEKGASCFFLTYLFGFVPEISEAIKICRHKNIFVIEDISQNIGALHVSKPLGMWGNAAIYSASLLKYVDGYNGAFALTEAGPLNAALNEYANNLSRPNDNRIRGIVLKTLIWNLALNRWFFIFITWPSLKALRFLSPNVFENLLGPGIPFARSTTLPGFYFESISMLQARSILRNLRRLQDRLAIRRRMARLAYEALMQVCGASAGSEKDHRQKFSEATFWQFVIPVTSTEAARSLLFQNGIETNTTNLRDLASEFGIILPGARTLKERCIFLPLHAHLERRDYHAILNLLFKSGYLDCERAVKMYKRDVKNLGTF